MIGLLSNLKRGIEIGSVKFPSKDVEDGDVTLPLKEIIRVATEQDIETYYQNDEDATNALQLCKDLVKNSNWICD